MDLLRGRIYNWFTFPAMVCGLAAAIACCGWIGARDSFFGIGAGFLLFAWIYALKFMGGGDVKFLMVFGAWGGPRYALDVAVMSVVLGGILAIFSLLFRGELLGFLRRLYRFLLSVFIRELEIETPQFNRKSTLPFGVPIAGAALWVAISNPLVKWGLSPW